MHYLIYKITNKINNKIYIGKHKTKDLEDNYLGSGKHLKYAINKYGKETFEKQILFNFASEEEMNAKEKELVTEEFCKRKDTYNICEGGKGGFSYINKNDFGQHSPEKMSIMKQKRIQKLSENKQFRDEWIVRTQKAAAKRVSNLKRGLYDTKSWGTKARGVPLSNSHKEKIQKATKGKITVFDLMELKVVIFTNETKINYETNKSRFIGLRKAKKLKLI